MKHTAIISATLVIIASFFFISLSVQSSDNKPTAIAMTGDKDATWILTDQDELIYCWWPESPNSKTQQANCRVLNKYRVNRTQ